MASLYTARQPDGQGRIHYTDEEHGTWRILIARQLAALDGKAGIGNAEAVDPQNVILDI